MSRLQEVFGWLALRFAAWRKQRRQRRFERQLFRAAHRADKLAKTFRCKYVVLVIDGKPQPVPKQNLKKLIARHKFRKGVTIRDIMKHALYETL